jgi:hypothetical protein
MSKKDISYPSLTTLLDKTQEGKSHGEQLKRSSGQTDEGPPRPNSAPVPKHQPMHGYQIITKIRKTFGVYFGPSTIYPLLGALEKKWLREKRMGHEQRKAQKSL